MADRSATDRNADRQAALARRRRGRLLAASALVIFVAGAALWTGRAPEPAAAPLPEEPGTRTACDADTPEPADPQQYDTPPEGTIPEGTQLTAVIETSCGTIEMALLPDRAPRSVAAFVFLAQEGFYDGLLWHRVERNSVLQTGDPNGQNGEPPDGPGFTIEDEFPDRSSDYTYGVVGLANAGPGTSGSQFFIVVHDPDKSCDRKGRPQGNTHHCPAGFQPFYSIFAEVDEASYETLERIAALETRGGNEPVEAVKPIENVYIESIEIVEG